MMKRIEVLAPDRLMIPSSYQKSDSIGLQILYSKIYYIEIFLSK